jgi:hypothetical protein
MAKLLDGLYTSVLARSTVLTLHRVNILKSTQIQIHFVFVNCLLNLAGHPELLVGVNVAVVQTRHNNFTLARLCQFLKDGIQNVHPQSAELSA